MEINFALEKMYPKTHIIIMLIRSSGMGNCLFLHAQVGGVDHQEQTKPQIPGVCLRWHGNRSNWTNNKIWSNSWFATTGEGDYVEGQNNIIFSPRIYMKIEFSSQRRETSWPPTWPPWGHNVYKMCRSPTWCFILVKERILLANIFKNHMILPKVN